MLFFLLFLSSISGFWYGIEPSPALDLLQPILALDDIHNGYSCFLGHFDWHNGGWDQSDSFDVQPGETIFSTTTYDAATNSYQMMMMSLDHPSNKLVQSYPVNYGETFTDLYVVVEKQPPSCDQYPSNGQVIFANISAAWEGVVEKDIPWFAAQYQPACDSTPHILNNSTVSFTWSTSGPAQAPKDSAADASAIIPRPPRRFRRAAAAKQA